MSEDKPEREQVRIKRIEGESRWQRYTRAREQNPEAFERREKEAFARMPATVKLGGWKANEKEVASARAVVEFLADEASAPGQTKRMREMWESLAAGLRTKFLDD